MMSMSYPTICVQFLQNYDTNTWGMIDPSTHVARMHFLITFSNNLICIISRVGLVEKAAVLIPESGAAWLIGTSQVL